MTFECTGCGLCCTRMEKVLNTPPVFRWMEPLIAAFPYGTDENGACMMLVDGQCSVYEDRPLLCDVERMADELDIGMTKEVWFEMNYAGCRKLAELHVEIR